MPGPIIAQESVPVLPGDTAETLAARVLAVEHRIYPLALRRVAEGDFARDDRAPARPRHATLRFSAEVLPRLLTSSYSTV